MSSLAHELVAAEPASRGPFLYILHGFLGSRRNWRSFARRLVELRADWTAALVDLRLHGDSWGMEGPHSVAAAADDIAALHSTVDAADRPAAVLGHSLGGKIALAATTRLTPTPVQTWVIDSTPAAAGSEGGAARMLARLEASPASFSDRDAAVDWIEQGGFDRATARWMVTNVHRRGESWSWRLDAPGLRELLDDFGAADLWSVLEAPPAGADLHLVRASAGSILAPEDASRIRALTSRGEPVVLHELEGGHWLHIDNPEGLLDLIAARLPRLPVSSPGPSG